jgi:hypothetical protein
MILSNYTFSISNPLAYNFESWIKNQNKEVFKNIEILSDVKVYKLLTQIDPDSINYSIQFFFTDKIKAASFEIDNLPLFFQQLEMVFSGNYAYFPTILEEL